MSAQDIISTAIGANDISVVRTANHDQNSDLNRLNKEKLQLPLKFAEKQEKIVQKRCIPCQRRVLFLDISGKQKNFLEL